MKAYASKKSSHIKILSPFLDDEGVLRVWGILGNSNLSFDQIYAILFRNKHKFSVLIILHEHSTHLHAGRNKIITLVIRRQFWIINATCRHE